MMESPHRIWMPLWLQSIIGDRERSIASTAGVRVLCEDKDGYRLPPHQRIIEAPDGESFTICAKHMKIIG